MRLSNELFAQYAYQIFNSPSNCFVEAEYPPCFSAFRLPLGAPGFVPPCILHRRFPFPAGDWHSVPARVAHQQRGACSKGNSARGRTGPNSSPKEIQAIRLAFHQAAHPILDVEAV